MNFRIERAAETFIENLTGAEITVSQRFADEITSNQEFNKSLDDNRSSPGRRRFSSWGPGVSPTLGLVLYVVCRQVRPDAVVETGVASGVSSSYILQGLEDNKYGDLSSIDLPLWETQAGWIIPDYLRHRWHLIVGRSSDNLMPLLEKAGTIDVFLHDSEHSYENMLWEYQTAWAHLRGGGVLLSHNIDSSDAFSDFCRSVKLKYHKVESLGGLLKPQRVPGKVPAGESALN